MAITVVCTTMALQAAHCKPILWIYGGNTLVLEEDMLELDCTMLMPEEVFKTSRHVGKFVDWMYKDPVKGDYLRADHIENVLEARLKGDKSAWA